MKPIKHILIATDFSSTGKRAEERAALLAAEHDAGLTLLHTLPGQALQRLRERLMPGHAGSESQLLEHYRAALHRQAEDLGGRWRIEVTPLLVAGQAHREICRAADKLQVDLVVVGAMGEHPAREFFLGSTADRVVRESPVPVLVVRNQAREPYSRLLAAIDLSPHGVAVREIADRVAPAAHLTLAHVFEVPFESKLQFAGTSQLDIDGFRQTEREHALAVMRALAGVGDDRPDILVRHGMPEAELPEMMQETAAELVVTGKHGSSEIVDLLLGSMTKHLLRESGRDVLVVPPAIEDAL